MEGGVVVADGAVGIIEAVAGKDADHCGAGWHSGKPSEVHPINAATVVSSMERSVSSALEEHLATHLSGSLAWGGGMKMMIADNNMFFCV